MTTIVRPRQEPIAPRLGVEPAPAAKITEEWPHMIGSRRLAAKIHERNPDQVRRHCAPVACDVATRAPLYDLDDVGRVLAKLRRRVA